MAPSTSRAARPCWLTPKERTHHAGAADSLRRNGGRGFMPRPPFFKERGRISLGDRLLFFQRDDCFLPKKSGNPPKKSLQSPKESARLFQRKPSLLPKDENLPPKEIRKSPKGGVYRHPKRRTRFSQARHFWRTTENAAFTENRIRPPCRRAAPRGGLKPPSNSLQGQLKTAILPSASRKASSARE